MSKEREYKQPNEQDKMSPECFLYLLTPVQGRIYAYIMSRWPNKSDADDIMQETISILWKKFDTYEPGTEFLAWTFTTAKYVLSGFRRRHQKNPIQFSEEALAALESQSEEFLSDYLSQIELLRQCIQKLEFKEAKLLELKYESGLSSQKIATHFGMSLRTFYRVLSKTLSTLMRCMNLSAIGGKV